MFGKKQEEEKQIFRHPVLLDRKDVLLLVVDMQEKFAPVIPDFGKITKNVCTLLKTFQMFNLHVLIVEQYPKGLGKTVKEISDCFPIMEVTEKLTFSAVQNNQFYSRLDALKLKKIVVCGIETHVCVHQTVHDLLHRGYQTWVVNDAIGSRTAENHQIGLQRMVQAGATVTTVEMMLFEMAFQAGTESFSQIQKMIK
jgi:nicotinamidase-related amidase